VILRNKKNAIIMIALEVIKNDIEHKKKTLMYKKMLNLTYKN